MSNRLAERPLPAGWKARSLRDVVSRVTRRNDVKNGNVLTISAHNGLINQEEFFSRRIASTDLSPYFLLERGDFAYNKSYSAGFPVGVIRRLDRYPQGVVSPLYICFRPNSPNVSSDYLAHYFQSGLLDDGIAWIAKEGARNHGLLNVGVDDLFSVAIHVPPFAEQVRIAEILDTADEEIRSTERLIAKLEQAKQGLLRDLLTRGINDSGHLRDPERLKQTSLGLLPEEWTVGLLGKVLASIDAGRSPDLPDRPAQAGEWGVLKVSAVRPDGLQEDENKVVTRPSLIDAEIEVKHGDLLISRANTPALVGLACYVRRSRPGLMLSDKTLRLNIDSELAVPEFVGYSLQSPSCRRQIETSGTGSSGSMKNISQDEIRSLIIPLPGIQEQYRILTSVGGPTVHLDVLRRELSKLRLLKQGLMDDLLRGRVRVGASA
jgi:type I restriction enzyme, S subunit